uniref:Uncharacterized protein n=1 Tax=Oryza meridionalis TaxID=40149 RepID=A0A0E0DKP7_9ORYZ
MWFSYSAYRKYVVDPECIDRRSEKKKKNGTTLKLKRNFPCSKQPPGIVLIVWILHLRVHPSVLPIQDQLAAAQ